MGKTYDQIYDELLVLRCQAGDAGAFEELVNRWQKRLWLYACRLTGNETASWDVLQEVWVAIIKGIGRLEDASVFPRWAYRVVNNKCVDWIRKETHQRRLARHFSEEKETTVAPVEKYGSLKEALDLLSGKEQSLIFLYYVEGFDIKEMAEILNLAEGTVKSRLYSVREKLRRLIKNGSKGEF